MDIRSQLGAVLLPKPENDLVVLRSDFIFAAVMMVATVFWGDLMGSGVERDDYLASVVTSVGIVLPLALRRYRPLWMLTFMSLACTMQLIAVSAPTWSLLAIPIASYSVARYIGDHRSRSIVIIGTFGAIAGPLRWLLAAPLNYGIEKLIETVLPLNMLCWAWVLIPYLLGRRDRENALSEAERALAAIEKYERELASREQAVRMAETTARNEIARELHDIVAHSLSVIIVQADGGRALARKRPAAATEALDTISATGREALTEMRRIVGVLRCDPDENAQYNPSPGLDEIPALLATASCQTSLTTTGEVPEVSRVVGLTIYRIIQEALTNVIKHAGPQANAQVKLTYSPDRIVVNIRDDGGAGESSGAASPVPSGGFGLQGMRERVSALNGTLVTEPTGDGGWQVEAALPLDQTAARPHAIGDLNQEAVSPLTASPEDTTGAYPEYQGSTGQAATSLNTP